MEQENVEPASGHTNVMPAKEGYACAFVTLGNDDESNVSNATDSGTQMESAPQGSLQERFAQFRKEKQKFLRNQRALEKETQKQRHSPEQMLQLREKFLEQCYKYAGVPYARRYHEPGDEHYDSPIFLDCCGLVRQAMRDLKEDFGFTIGPWNQAYQLDTLPERVEKVTDLTPGDLVFYLGDYVKEGAKPQKHDCVHVEVYIGGERTLGARWGKGVVQEWDSYAFEAKSWKVKEYIYCKLDPWLRGECKSHCNLHEWKRTTWRPEGFSVFADEDDEAAGDVDNEGELQGDSIPTTKVQNSANVSTKKKTFYVSKGNNWEMISEMMQGMGWEMMPFESNGTGAHLTWVERRKDIDYVRLRSGQAANHIQNNDILTSKVGLLKTLREADRLLMKFKRTGKWSSETNAEYGEWLLPSDEVMPLTLNMALPSDRLVLLDEVEKDEGSVWVVKPPSNNQGHGVYFVSGKAAADKLSGRGMQAGEVKQLNEEKTDAPNPSENGETQEGAAPKQAAMPPAIKPCVVQRYVDPPQLLNGGYKWDNRCFLLVARTKPLIALFHPGYARVCLDKWSPPQAPGADGEIILDRTAHMTNLSVARGHPEYSQRKEETVLPMPEVAHRLQAAGTVDEMWLQQKWTVGCKKLLRAALGATLPHKLHSRSGCFDLFGADIIADQQGKPSLIEINSNPALWTTPEGLKSVIPHVVKGALTLAQGIVEKKIGDDIKQSVLDLDCGWQAL